MQARSGHIFGYKNMKVPYLLQSNTESSNGLAIFLPGMGYTMRNPLLHFASGAFFRKGFDVLHINYLYYIEEYEAFTIDELKTALHQDVTSVLNEVLPGLDYSSYYLLGKSLGTLAMPAALKISPLQNAKTVWLTPNLKDETVLHTMMTIKQNGLCIIGDEDPFYDSEKIEQLVRNTQMEYMIPKGINHALEVDHDVLKSIDAIKMAIQSIINFIDS
ncbi:hypothetical protein AWM68_01295 [Fictibacillus phosphorivorans]|uniref:Alpha/beta hydrolase n=1 Tax=Fictibacillus phosphorivorans TaxID=1221500 RepID=A0A165P4G3_9BACL|nr:alpha/beta hydrolase [Fictibacillus phosphorivorans]KZE68933.1 hypothetical protein AWM68_01295 [Fictibacillus phosphorivorans]